MIIIAASFNPVHPPVADPKGWMNTRESDRLVAAYCVHTKARTHGDRLKFGYWFHHLNTYTVQT